MNSLLLLASAVISAVSGEYSHYISHTGERFCDCDVPTNATDKYTFLQFGMCAATRQTCQIGGMVRDTISFQPEPKDVDGFSLIVKNVFFRRCEFHMISVETDDHDCGKAWIEANGDRWELPYYYQLPRSRRMVLTPDLAVPNATEYRLTFEGCAPSVDRTVLITYKIGN